MADQTGGPLSDDDKRFVQELTWKMLDDCIDEEEAEQLDVLLLASEPARHAYVEIVQLHVDLLDFFGALPRSEELIKKILDQKLAESKSKPQLPAAEIPTTERSGA